jgi:hypothetical protein
MLTAVPGIHPRRRPAAPSAAVAARAVAAVAAAGLVFLVASGCSSFNKALGQQEEVVIFQSNTPNSVRLQVRAACSHVAQVVPEPLPTDHKVSDEVYDVRYQVGTATTAELAQLQQCLSRFRSVLGLETNTPCGI